MEGDLYAELGVERDASNEQIEKAYRELALIHHPDTGGSAEKFRAISTARKVLTDSKARKEYDGSGEYVKPNDVEQALRELVEAVFEKPSVPRDPIRFMKETVDRARADDQRLRDDIPIQIKRVEKRLEKFRKDNERTKNVSGRAALVMAFEFRISQLNRKLEVCLHRIKVANAVLAILSDLTYDSSEGGAAFDSFFARTGWHPSR